MSRENQRDPAPPDSEQTVQHKLKKAYGGNVVRYIPFPSTLRVLSSNFYSVCGCSCSCCCRSRSRAASRWISQRRSSSLRRSTRTTLIGWLEPIQRIGRLVRSHSCCSTRSGARPGVHSIVRSVSWRPSQNRTACRASKPACARSLRRGVSTYERGSLCKEESAYLTETTSASTSCFWLVQYCVSSVRCPDPNLPTPARASLTKGPTVCARVSTYRRPGRQRNAEGTHIAS